MGYRPQFGTRVFAINPDPDLDPDDRDYYHAVGEYVRFALDELEGADRAFYFPMGRRPEVDDAGVRRVVLPRVE